MKAPDIPEDLPALDSVEDLPVHRVETERAGRFTFQVGIDAAAVRVALIRVEDAWRRFSASPLAQVANQLQREVLVESVFGTNTIEGAELTEEETSRALDLDPARVQAEQDVRVRNIKAAYDLAIAPAPGSCTSSTCRSPQRRARVCRRRSTSARAPARPAPAR